MYGVTILISSLTSTPRFRASLRRQAESVSAPRWLTRFEETLRYWISSSISHIVARRVQVVSPSSPHCLQTPVEYTHFRIAPPRYGFTRNCRFIHSPEGASIILFRPVVSLLSHRMTSVCKSPQISKVAYPLTVLFPGANGNGSVSASVRILVMIQEPPVSFSESI